ncbi:hypothetical protein [uncultured Paraglaciecola sp.]|uniref:hypothetical protein n=1 Tax=uncultured Paraglaciecola sp. TaxID=1765024 RepID=UPI0026064A71|nr:hypothetical protein [uncultured Paraglaciecola sp.]
MATAQKIVSDALTELRMQSELIPADPQLEQDALDRLIGMLEEWASAGIATGTTIPTLLSSELSNPRDIELGLAHSLALEMSTRAPQEPARRLLRAWRRSRRRIKARYGPNPEQAYPASLPLGQGNNIGPRSKRFFPEPTTLGNNSDSIGT